MKLLEQRRQEALQKQHQEFEKNHRPVENIQTSQKPVNRMGNGNEGSRFEKNLERYQFDNNDQSKAKQIEEKLQQECDKNKTL